MALLLSLHTSGTAAGTSIYQPPVDDPDIVRPYEEPEHGWGPGHRGIDLRSHEGAPLSAPADGVVTFVGVVVDRGVLVISHADGLRSTLEPIRADVAEGDHVIQGQVVGTLEERGSHCLPVACVHWGVRRGDTYVDPWLLIDATPRPVRLLPLCTDAPGDDC